MVVKKPIVSGKKPGDIPYTKNQIEALKEFLNMPELADYNAKSGKDPELLSSTIINSTEKKMKEEYKLK